MNRHIWGGIAICGFLVSCFALGAMNPMTMVANSFFHDGPDKEVFFLLTGGIVTCLIGSIGLIRIMIGFEDANDQYLEKPSASTSVQLGIYPPQAVPLAPEPNGLTQVLSH